MSRMFKILEVSPEHLLDMSRMFKILEVSPGNKKAV